MIQINPHNYIIHLVLGPPRAGKTTFVRQNKSPGDLVIDQDALAAALSYTEMHQSPDTNIRFVWDLMDLITIQLKLGSPTPNHVAWVISSNSGQRARNLIRVLNPTKILVIPTNADVCLERLRLEESNRPYPAIAKAIHQWWEQWEVPAGSKVEFVTLRRNLHD